MLTQEQLVALKADIVADSTLSQWAATGHMAEEIAHAYNEIATPDFIVWRSSVSWADIMGNGMDWTRVDNLSVGKARIWEWMFIDGIMNAAKANIRAGVDAVWVGTAADLAVRAMVYTHCKRPANRIEKLLAVGNGTTASPSTMSYEGDISYQDVEFALQS